MKLTTHSRIELFVHLVWTTKERAPVLSTAFWAYVAQLAKTLGREQKVILLATGGMDDHVHVLVRYRPDTKVSEIAHRLKGTLSHWLRREGNIPDFTWQEGYGAFSVSPWALPEVERYIGNQGEHHQRGTTKNDIEPD